MTASHHGEHGLISWLAFQTIGPRVDKPLEDGAAPKGRQFARGSGRPHVMWVEVSPWFPVPQTE